MLKLLNSPSPKSWAGQRNRALLEFFYGTGLRLGEVQSLDLSDLYLEEQLVRVRQSKAKPRWAVMGDRLTAVMRDYQQRIRPLAQKDAMEAALWINAAGQRLTYAGICGLFKKLGRRAGLSLSPHALRHAYATHLLQGGAPLRWIQALLGHQALMATQIYTQLAPSDLLAEFRRIHPRARRKRTRERADRATSGPAPGPRPAAGDVEALAPLPAEL